MAHSPYDQLVRWDLKHPVNNVNWWSPGFLSHQQSPLLGSQLHHQWWWSSPIGLSVQGEPMPWETHDAFIFRSFDTYFERLKPSFFHGFGGPKVVGGFKPVERYSIKFNHFCKARGKNKTYFETTTATKRHSFGSMLSPLTLAGLFLWVFCAKNPPVPWGNESWLCCLESQRLPTKKRRIRMGGFSIQRCLFQSSHFWSSIWLWFTKVLYWSNVTSASQYHGSYQM